MECGGLVVGGCNGSVVWNVVAHWYEMWWLSGRECNGTVVGAVVAQQLIPEVGVTKK
jgi:hypothetical protein